MRRGRALLLVCGWVFARVALRAHRVVARGACMCGDCARVPAGSLQFYRQSVPDCEKSDFYHFQQKKYIVNFYCFKFNLPNFYRTPTLDPMYGFRLLLLRTLTAVFTT